MNLGWTCHRLLFRTSKKQCLVMLVIKKGRHHYQSNSCKDGTLGLRFTFHIGFVHPLQDVALHQCLPLSSVAFLSQVVPSFLAMLSCHLLLGRPLDLFPPLDLLVVTLCSIWSTYCPSFLLYVQPISTFVSACILLRQVSLFFA